MRVNREFILNQSSVFIFGIRKCLELIDDIFTAIRTEDFIKADSAEPKSIQYFRQQGFRMVGARKFPGSRLQYTKKVKRFKKIFCSDRCENVIYELKTLTYAKDKNGARAPFLSLAYVSVLSS